MRIEFRYDLNWETEGSLEMTNILLLDIGPKRIYFSVKKGFIQMNEKTLKMATWCVEP